MLCPAAATAQSVGQAPLNFNENLREEAEISGALVAGLQRGEGLPRPEATSVWAEVPAGWAGGLACLRVSTANGLYDSVAEYMIPGGAQVVPLEFPTRHARYLAERPEGGVAALMSKGACAEEVSESAIVRWDEAADAPAILYLNAFRADRVYVYLGADPEPVECTPLSGDVRTAYDVRCDLGTLPETEAVNLEILGVTNGQPSDPAVLTLTPMAAR